MEEVDKEQAQKFKVAISEKNAALRSKRRLRKESTKCLQNWHSKQDLRGETQDELTNQKKINTATEKILQRYKSMIEESTEKRRGVQKEWASEAAARRHGGGRRRPPWIIQLICELLINWTAPSATPKNIMTMYAILLDTKPKEQPPSVDFVCQCRPMVQVIGETVTAMKLAKAKAWGQLWTDTTTRRQIPFTALIIGLLGEDGGDMGAMSMSKAIESIEEKMIALSSRSEKKVDENFMMGFFSEYMEELPPMREYWDIMYQKKQMRVVACKSGTKVVHFSRLCKNLFCPIR